MRMLVTEVAAGKTRPTLSSILVVHQDAPYQNETSSLRSRRPLRFNAYALTIFFRPFLTFFVALRVSTMSLACLTIAS